jgi:predicted Zn-dependent protease
MFLAQLLAASHDWLGVRDTLQPICADDDTDVDAASRLADALLEADKAPEALELARHAVEVQPRHAPVRLACARALVKCDRAAEALATLDEGLGLLPGFSGFQLEKAKVLRQLGRAAEADELEKSLKR